MILVSLYFLIIPNFVSLKKTLSIALIAFLCSGFLINIGIYTWFQVEQNYIAAELCENRFVPDSECGGHCVLEKKIKDVNQQNQYTVEFKLLSFILCDHPKKDFTNNNHVKDYPSIQDKLSSEHTNSIFRPPIT
ncbi:MAG: hypothetical protein ACI8SE_000270 [Bacteroidia bacterium]|jgi:hypothetical protein